ncbi:MAG: quinolinate synthase NadA [Planctomycetes bacterium]|nr:quinolinate synthase NadA [Planctomycetota bacterium]
MMTAEELHEKLSTVDTGVCNYTVEKCREYIPLVNKILQLKKEKNAIILAHTYVNPEILYGVADHVGDSYLLSDIARKSEQDTIIFVAVTFMAETAKILSPTKQVFHTNLDGGCSLADSITGQEVADLRKKHPEHTFVCYINTTAEVKAQCDICVTSSNVYQILESLENDKIFFLPDRLMAQNLQVYLKEKGIDKEILYSEGSCYVHETYDAEMIDYLRLKHEGIAVAVHPECAPSVTHKADYVGSTGGIYNYVKETGAPSYALVTECGLSSRIQVECPQKKIVGSCAFCKYMQGNTLDNIAHVLETSDSQYEVKLDLDLVAKASTCIENMFSEVEKSNSALLS